MTTSARRRVLVVEDDSDTGEMLRFTLEGEGYSVMVAESAAAAEERWGKFSPHLIVTDYMMPGKTGLELLEYLRERVLVPIIIYTAYPSELLKTEADRRFAAMVPKGEIDSLVQEIRKLFPI